MFLFFLLFFLAFGANNSRQPISVYARAYIYFMQNLEAHDLVIIIYVDKSFHIFLFIVDISENNWQIFSYVFKPEKFKFL